MRPLLGGHAAPPTRSRLAIGVVARLQDFISEPRGVITL